MPENELHAQNEGNFEYSRIAGLYDSYVKVDFDIPFFLEEATKVSGEVLELMSGTGRVSLPLVKAGVRLTCVDYSQEMLAILQQKLDECQLSADLYTQDIGKLNLSKTFDLIIIPFHSFSELITQSDQRRALVRVIEHLSDHGRFICTMHNPALRLRSIDGLLHLWNRVTLPNNHTLLIWALQKLDSANNIVHITEFFEEYDSDGDLLSKKLFELRFCPIDKQEFEELARIAGFTVEAMFGDYTYSDYDDASSPFMIWILKK